LKQGQPIQKCITCHDVKETKGKVLKLQLAYHTNCKECHKTLKKGPVDKCTDCHAKK
jgi:DnaJ-class molecular chaperone